MRILKFIVDDQIIKKDPNCNFDDLVPGTEGYLQASFSFTPEWKDCVKVASFYSIMGNEYEPQLLADGVSCKIPVEALKRRSFKVQIVGKRPDGYHVKTNKITINQNGGK